MGGAYEAGFFLHGSRHQTADANLEIQRLEVGSQLLLQPETDNQHDACAQQIIASGLRIGSISSNRHINDIAFPEQVLQVIANTNQSAV
jgi:hypothetical protein